MRVTAISPKDMEDIYDVLTELEARAAERAAQIGYPLEELRLLRRAIDDMDAALAREDRAVAPDMVFLPFAYVEAAANILTNPAVDPFGKIPEFKFSAVRVEKVEDQIAAE